MRKFGFIALAAVLIAVPAAAELQNVTVDGSIQIRGNYYSNLVPGVSNARGVVAGGGAASGITLRWPGAFLPARPIGALAAFPGGGVNSIASAVGFNEKDPSLDFYEQRTRLGVMADFTNDVSAYIEFDYYTNWGSDFRSNYQTGFDGARNNNSDVQLYQSYIEAREMWGYPLQLRIGRQEMTLGSGWLVGTNDNSSFFTGLSFDAIRLDYATDTFSVTAFAAKLAENSAIEQDEDVDFYGIYGSYLGLEDVTIDAYWLFLRDARSLNDTNFIAPVEWIEDALGLDDYDPTTIHTFGLRGAGTYGAFDYEAEIAYQTGDVDAYGFTFKPFGVYGDDSLDLDEFAFNLEVGYTFDMQYTPRVYLGLAYFGGEDERDISFVEWLNPFDRPEGSTAFHRLFSNWEYSEFHANTDLSNIWILRGGVSFSPTETIDVLVALSYFEAVDEFDQPVSFNLGGFRIPVAPALSFWTEENDASLGWELGVYATYNYSEDLSFEVGWAHLFVGETDGQFVNGNGFLFHEGTSDDDADYLYFQTKIAF